MDFLIGFVILVFNIILYALITSILHEKAKCKHSWRELEDGTTQCSICFKVIHLNVTKNKRIFVLEDDKNISKLTYQILSDAGYWVRTGDYESVENIMKFSPALILMDFKLSNGFGNALCLDLKNNPVTSQIPVILFSNSEDIETIANDCLADNYLSEPFHMDNLVDMVKSYG